MSLKALTKQTVMISAGDPSADQHAAALIRQLQQQRPDARIMGMGGQQMQAAGMETVVDASDLAIVGFVEIFKRYFTLRRALNRCICCLAENRPSLLILVDYAAFNLRLAKAAKTLGIPTLYYISPQVWAWRRYRVKTIRNVVDHMAVIYPFEKTFYEQYQVPVSYVGHPAVGKVAAFLDANPCTTVDEQALTPTIGLLPGSRKSEIKQLLPIMLAAAKLIQQRYPAARFVLAKASNLHRSLIESQLCLFPSLLVEVNDEHVYECIMRADALIAASGTVTLEVGLLAKPYVLIYKVNRLSAWLARRLLHIPFIGITNIIAGKAIIKECLHRDCRADLIAAEVDKILSNEPYKTSMLAELAAVSALLDNQHIDLPIAQLVLSLIDVAAQPTLAPV